MSKELAISPQNFPKLEILCVVGNVNYNAKNMENSRDNFVCKAINVAAIGDVSDVAWNIAEYSDDITNVNKINNTYTKQ